MYGTGPSRRAMLGLIPGAALAGATASTAEPLIGELALGGLELDPGEHGILRDTTITGPVTVRPGARFNIAAGATLTLLGDVLAPADQVFTGEGHVDLTRSRLLAARPEWWGAAADDAAVDCVPAFTACLRAHPAMALGPGDYHLGSTWVVDQPNRRVWGIGRTNGARGTRLLGLADNGPVVLVGSDRAPAAINDYLRGLDMRWIEIGRARPARTPTGDDADAPTGLAVRHVLDCVFEELRVHEHAIGYSIRGAVRTYLRDCTAFRSVFADPARDMFVGFDMDGRTPPISTGANASLYLIDCNARTGNRPALAVSVGARLQGALSDTFLVRFETTEVATGILVDGLIQRLAPAQRRFGHVDLHIDTPVLDQCSDAGLRITNLSGQAMVDVSSPYVALNGTGRAALLISRSGGTIGVSGGQLIGALSPGAIGIALDSTSGVGIAGTKLLGFARPVAVTDSSGFDLVVAINAAEAPSGHPAVQLARCRTGYCRPRIVGPVGAHSVAVAMDAATSGVTIETAAIERVVVGRLVTRGEREVAPSAGSAICVPPSAPPSGAV